MYFDSTRLSLFRRYEKGIVKMRKLKNQKFENESICYDIGRFLSGVQPSISLAQYTPDKKSQCILLTWSILSSQTGHVEV